MNKVKSQVNSPEVLEKGESSPKSSIKPNLLIPRLYERTFTSRTPYKLLCLKRRLPKVKESKSINY